MEAKEAALVERDGALRKLQNCQDLLKNILDRQEEKKAWEEEKERLEREKAEINNDFIQCKEEMVGKDKQIDSLAAEIKVLEVQVDNLSAKVEGYEEDFKSNITEVCLRTRIEMMQAHKDNLHMLGTLRQKSTTTVPYSLSMPLLMLPQQKTSETSLIQKAVVQAKKNPTRPLNKTSILITTKVAVTPKSFIFKNFSCFHHLKYNLYFFPL